MADRFPLIVNSVSKKIEELVSGDNLDLTGNGIVVSTDTGAGKYLTSDGTTVFWGSPGDVYLTQTQTITNKTLESSIISGSLNTLSDIPNTALVNSGITVNSITIPLGGSVVTPDNNTTYVVSAQDGLSASEKIIRLTSGGNFGAGVNDDVILAVGVPTTVPSGSNTVSLFLDRVGDKVTVSGHVVDNNTITTLNAPGGTNTSGAINFTSTGAATVSMTGSTINVDALDTDTRTKIRAGSGGTYGPSDTQQGLFTFLDGTGTVVSQGVDGSGDPTITYTSTDNVTQIRGGSTGTYTPTATGTAVTQISIEGGSALGGNTQVTQSGNTILIDSTDTNTVTKVGSDNNGSPIAPAAGDFIFKQAGATTVTQTTNQSGQVEITVSSVNSDTGATLTASNGILLSSSDFRLKNASNLGGNKVLKWDDGNAQLANSIISDDGTTVTIDGDLIVEGNQTILNTSILQVEDNIIELRKGTSIVGSDGGIQVNRTTDGNGVVTSYKQLQWHESGSYWRSWDGSVEQRLVTETETQVLTNKTLTNPTLTTPTLGAATATSINGLEIASTASAVLDIQSGKTVDINNDLTLKTDNTTGNTNVNFRVGGDVAFKSDTLASFASTTATQLRTLISGTTGVDDLVFQTSPVILTSLVTTSTGFALLNSGAQSIQFGGAATAIDVGSQSGTVTFNGDVVVGKDLTVGTASTDLLQCNARIDVANSDILIRGGTSDPMTVGRGTSAVASNTAVGKQALLSVVSGSQNSAVGYESLLTVNSGAGNTGFGHQVLRSTGVGDGNTAMGRGAMLSNLSGDNNVALGSNALETNTVGNANVCLGYFAGYNVAGSGNVLIGPADSGNPVNDATYSPLNPSGDRQLVIGSGTEFWVRGDSNFDVTVSNDLTVNTDLTVKGDLVVNGVTTTIKSNTLEVSDKNIELAKVVSTQFTCTTADGSANISSISPTLGLIPGMVVTSNTAGVSVPNNTTIVSLSSNTAVLSNNVSGTGTPTFSAIGPSDTAADGGGIILDGTTDHTFTWSNANDAWQSSENMDIANGKTYNIIDGNGNARQMLSLTQIGPTAGTGVVAGLGSGVTSSVLTSVGTLTNLEVSGNVDFTGGVINLGIADTSSGHINALENMTFNIDTDDDDTNRTFKFCTNATTGSGSTLLQINEDGKLTCFDTISIDSAAGHIVMGDSELSGGAVAVDPYIYLRMGSLVNTSNDTEVTALLITDNNSRQNQTEGSGSWKSKIQFNSTQINGNTASEGASIVHDITYNNYSGNKMRSDLVFKTRGDEQTASSDPAEERLRIRHDGVVIVGKDNESSTTATQDFDIRGRYVNAVGSFARIMFRNSTDSGNSSASIRGVRTQNNFGTELHFFTHNSSSSGGDGSHRGRFRANGDFTTKNEDNENRQTAGFTARNGDSVQCTRDAGTPLEICRTSNTGAFINFFSGTTAVASVSYNGSTMTYGGQSDYRLKENIVEMTGGIDAVKQLNPIKFNFISSPERTVEGFLAHEVQEVVPQAVVGEKDAEIDEEGKGYQQLDSSQLVPTLTAALQEAIAKIESLEARVAELES